MTSLHFEESSLPDLTGKVAIITGGASGIGYAAANILTSRGAKVHILDRNAPSGTEHASNPSLEFLKCDVTDWNLMRGIFHQIGRVDMAFANAGISEVTNSFTDHFDDQNQLLEPNYDVLDVNLRSVINFVKLAWHSMRLHGVAGSIVITTSATAYAPEQSLPVYATSKIALTTQLVGLVRALRSTVLLDNITINAVAPAATLTALLPPSLAAPIIAAGLPVSSAHFVGLALVYSATAMENRRVQAYGKEKEEENEKEGRWNGRVILTLKDSYTELEEKTADLRGAWFGEENLKLTRLQQATTDFR
ncbi:MAG: hypothetical protein ASARMPRED_005285 [Alectoria sarmentosa]|nr:MAG: hypothetical protein ASARMPRED_005285 [Alectoria sarmentosa]